MPVPVYLGRGEHTHARPRRRVPHDITVMVSGCQASRIGSAARRSFPIFYFLFSIFCFGWLAGCAAPGEPTPKHPLVPEAIADLAARQAGDAVALTFTLPRKS